MSVTYIDTNKIQSIGTDIIKLSTEYQVEINRLFKRLNEVPMVTREWVGQQANKYFNIIAFDKNDYLEFGEQIKRLGKEVLKIADSFEVQIKKNADEESRR